MKKIEKKKLITLICIAAGVVAVVILCVCLSLGNKDNAGSDKTGQVIGSENEGNNEENDTESTGNQESDASSNSENPSIELEEDSFEDEDVTDGASGNNNSSNNDGSDQNGGNNGSGDSSSDNGGAIVLPEVAIP